MHTLAKLDAALASNQLHPAIILHGASLSALESAALKLSCQLLSVGNASKVLEHPDLFVVRPSNKMRQISAEDARLLLQSLQQTPQQGPNKVALIYEADRLHRAASNILLKTLEEPSAGTTMLLLTTRPYELLPTVRSRCLQCHVSCEVQMLEYPTWDAWARQYTNWLERLTQLAGPPTKGVIAELILAAYGLISQFSELLESLSAERWKAQSKALPEILTPEAILALESGVSKSTRQELFVAIANLTCSFAKKHPQRTTPALVKAMGQLERVSELLQVNLNEATALESFFLHSLKYWSTS